MGDDLREIRNGVRMISKESAVSIGLGLVVLAAALFLERRISGIEHSMDLMRADMTAIREDLAFAASDRYRKQDARETFRELQRLNPSLSVPDPGNGNMPFARTPG